MSQYEEVVQVVESIAGGSETKSYELKQYAESLERFIASFSSVVNGTNDPSAKNVCVSFTTV